MEYTLKIEHLKTQFETTGGIVPAVDDVSIEIPRGKIVGLVGESGCGKSMTAMSIMQLVKKPGKIVDGKILFKGRDLLAASAEEMRQVRGNDISMIFQEPMTSLNPVYTVGRQVREAVLLHQKVSKDEAREPGHRDLSEGAGSRSRRSGIGPIPTSSREACGSGS